MKNAVILGGGVGGLSAAWMLARKKMYHVTVVEASPAVGGICGTFNHGDFLLDYGPHKFYSVIPGIMDEAKDLMGQEFVWHEKKNCIYLANQFLKYPLSMADLLTKLGLNNMVSCAQSAFGVLLKRGNSKPPESYEDYLIAHFGRQIYKLIFEPLADKVWGDPSSLSADIAHSRIPNNGLLDVFLRATGIKKESPLTSAKHFYYPCRGFGRIAERIREEIVKCSGEVLTETLPTKINSEGGRITAIEVKKGGEFHILPCDLLVSSIHLDKLTELLWAKEKGLQGVMRDGHKLQYRHALLAYIFLNREQVTDQHWLFFPQRDIIFGRVFEPKLMSKEVAPQQDTVLCCDFTDYEGGRLWNQPDQQLIARCISDLEKVGIIKHPWVKKTFMKRLPKAYPRYGIGYKDAVSLLYRGLKQYVNLLLTGRVGFFNYNNSDHCIDMGRFIADNLESGKEPSWIWEALEQRVAGYQIVD